MWQCKQCHTNIDNDEFEVCWNCNSEKNPSTHRTQAERSIPKCIRCDASLCFIGTKNFHEGTRWGLLGDLGEFFVNKENLDMFACKSCGKVEFFVAGAIKR